MPQPHHVKAAELSPARAWRSPPGVLGAKQEGPMAELYVFRGTTGHAEMVMDDKSGKKLPPHSFGQWVFSRTINVTGETHLMGGVNCEQVLANVAKDGFHHWPELEPDLPPVRPPTLPSRFPRHPAKPEFQVAAATGPVRNPRSGCRRDACRSNPKRDPFMRSLISAPRLGRFRQGISFGPENFRSRTPGRLL